MHSSAYFLEFGII